MWVELALRYRGEGASSLTRWQRDKAGGWGHGALGYVGIPSRDTLGDQGDHECFKFKKGSGEEHSFVLLCFISTDAGGI